MRCIPPRQQTDDVLLVALLCSSASSMSSWWLPLVTPWSCRPTCGNASSRTEGPWRGRPGPCVRQIAARRVQLAYRAHHAWHVRDLSPSLAAHRHARGGARRAPRRCSRHRCAHVQPHRPDLGSQGALPLAPPHGSGWSSPLKEENPREEKPCGRMGMGPAQAVCRRTSQASRLDQLQDPCMAPRTSSTPSCCATGVASMWPA